MWSLPIVIKGVFQGYCAGCCSLHGPFTFSCRSVEGVACFLFSSWREEYLSLVRCTTCCKPCCLEKDLIACWLTTVASCCNCQVSIISRCFEQCRECRAGGTYAHRKYAHKQYACKSLLHCSVNGATEFYLAIVTWVGVVSVKLWSYTAFSPFSCSRPCETPHRVVVSERANWRRGRIPYQKGKKLVWNEAACVFNLNRPVSTQYSRQNCLP